MFACRQGRRDSGHAGGPRGAKAVFVRTANDGPQLTKAAPSRELSAVAPYVQFFSPSSRINEGGV